MATASTLTELAQFILSNVSTLESTYTASTSSQFPSLDEPSYSPQEKLDSNTALMRMRQSVVAAATQLIARVNPVLDTLCLESNSMYTASALQFVDEVNVATVLNSYGSDGLHVDDIAVKTGVKDSSKIARYLRYLATRHIFREVSPDVFANNRISAAMVKAKPLEEVRSDPISQYDGAPGASIVGHMTGGLLKSTSNMKGFIENGKDHESPFAMAHGISYWKWFEQPGNEMYFRRFSEVMKVINSNVDPAVFVSSFDWSSLGSESTVVDVGAGTGQVTLALAKSFPQNNYVVQDLPSVIEDTAIAYWQAEAPAMIESNKVKLQGHNFFCPQPVQNAAVYMMRFVLHNWPKDKCVEIMKNLRLSAGAGSKLILFEFGVPHACASPQAPPSNSSWMSSMRKLFNNNTNSNAPRILNSGGAFITSLDMLVLNAFDGQERTVDEFRELGHLSGWDLETTVQGPVAAIIYSTSQPEREVFGPFTRQGPQHH